MKRHLIFHICPLIGSENVWQRHIRNIRTVSTLFNGKIVIAVVVGSGLASVETVQELMRDIPVTEWIVAENKPGLNESVTFVRLLEAVQFEDGITFRGHCKAVSHQHDPIQQAWSKTMWETCMDTQSVDEALKDHVFAGSLKIQEGEAIMPDAYRWFFAGTFFWFQNAAVFARNWRAEHRTWDRWYAEWWPGDLAVNREAFCFFMDDITRRHFRPSRWSAIVEARLSEWRHSHPDRIKGLE